MILVFCPFDLDAASRADNYRVWAGLTPVDSLLFETPPKTAITVNHAHFASLEVLLVFGVFVDLLAFRAVEF